MHYPRALDGDVVRGRDAALAPRTVGVDAELAVLLERRAAVAKLVAERAGDAVRGEWIWTALPALGAQGGKTWAFPPAVRASNRAIGMWQAAHSS